MKKISGANILAVVVLALVGCGDGDDPGSPTPIPSTATPTSTVAVPTPTPTPTPDESGHHEILLGSSADGGGSLRFNAEFEGMVEVPFFECLGGSGDECVGGTRLYVATDPGITSEEAVDEPDEGFFALDDGVTVRLTLVHGASGVRLKFEDTLLQNAGDSVVLGTTPEQHADFEWQIAVESGQPLPEHADITIRLTSDSASYSASDDIVVRLTPVAEESH